MINNVSLVGRITAEPELKQTQTGKSVVSFTLAVNRTFNKDESDFILIQTWNHSADFVGRYVNKGDLLGLTGRIQTRNYDDKQGNRVYITEVVADSVQALESRSEKEARQGYSPIEKSMSDTRRKHDVNDYVDLDQETFGGPTLDISSDDLPF